MAYEAETGSVFPAAEEAAKGILEHHLSMVIELNESKLDTTEQIREFLTGTSARKDHDALAETEIRTGLPVGCELIIKRLPGYETGHGSTVASRNDQVWQERARMHRHVGPVSYRRVSDEHAVCCNSG